MEKKIYKLEDKNFVIILFSLCFLVYLSTYLGRLNYTASLTEILKTQGFSKAQGGLIGTVFFFTYGIGQFISGFLGDKFSAKKLVFIGTFVSAIINIIMANLITYKSMSFFWAINGLAQALIWSPMLKLIVQYLKEDIRTKACIYLNLSVPIGTMLAYIMTAGVIYTSSWRMVFLISGSILLIISFLWFFGLSLVEKNAKEKGSEYIKNIKLDKNIKTQQTFNWFNMMCSSGFIFLLFSLIVQGTLKDGVTTWVPIYINETYNIGEVAAIIGTIIIPIFNIFGVYFASLVNRKLFKDEIKTSSFFFFVCALSLSILFVFSGKSVVISLLMLGISTTTMMAVNTMLIALLPTHFEKIDKASSISGILNSFIYIGGAISTYSIGSVSEKIGWNGSILYWIILAIISSVICLTIFKKWHKYKMENLY